MSDLRDVSDPTCVGEIRLQRWSLHLPVPLWAHNGEEKRFWNMDFAVVVTQATFAEETDATECIEALQKHVPTGAIDCVSRQRDDLTQLGYRYPAQGCQPVAQWYFLHGLYLLDLRMIFQLDRDLALAHAIADSVKPMQYT